MPPGKGRHSGSGCHMAHILTDGALQIRDLDGERLRVGDRRRVSTLRRGSGTGSQGSTTRRRTQTRVGQHLVDGAPIATDHHHAETGQQPSGMVGCRLEGHPRLIVATPSEALLALPARLGAALDVPLTGLGVDDRARR